MDLDMSVFVYTKLDAITLARDGRFARLLIEKDGLLEYP
jgi:hypothetical protein